MEVGLIRKIDIDSEMQQSYLDYAMSVIVARALPDARDGLKPVQRRILYAMYDMGLRSDSTYKKSARIVGEVLGKYHPHGDMAVYEAMARLAQDFTVRNPLVDGQGNFGSVDGDPPAAMRYTEARLQPFALRLLEQIDRDTVDFAPNFDGTLNEPLVLPAAVPNLLVNGASGIAVGMATSIPPHNLGEVVDALIFMLHQWDKLDDIAIPDLMRFIQGPDFPTGGILLQEGNEGEMLRAYASGHGRVVVRGKVRSESMDRGRSRLIITELPYLTNKSTLIERIAELVRDGNLEGIADLRDESDQHGMRVVIELNKSADVDAVLRALYHRTPLQSTFTINLLALVDGEPRLLSLKQALRVYLEHRLVVVRRRSEFDLARCKQRAHLLEGLRIAIDHLDEIITLIRNSPDVETARSRLIKRFKMSEIQAQAVLEMQLRRLAALERKKIETEYRELLKTIKELEALLHSPKRMRQVVSDELADVKQAHADPRRTQIVSLRPGESAKTLLTTTAVTPSRDVWVGVTGDGLIARTKSDDMPRLFGKNIPRFLIRTNTHHTVYLVAQDGRAAAISAEAIPEAENTADGVPLSKVSPLERGEPLTGIFSMPDREQIEGDWYILTASRMGLVKKSPLADLPGPASQAFILARTNPGDRLVWVGVVQSGMDLCLVTSGGMAIRFPDEEVRSMGLVAAGVNGIKLQNGEEVVGLERLGIGGDVTLLASDGRAWRIPEEEFPLQGRYGLGTIACKLPTGTRLVGSISGKKTQLGLVFYRKAATRSLKIGDLEPGRRMRSSQAGVPVKPDDAVLSLTAIWDGLDYWKLKTRRKRKKARS